MEKESGNERGKIEKTKHELTGPIIVGLLVLIIALIFFIYNSGKSLTGNIIADNLNPRNCKEIQVPYQVEESYDFYLRANIENRASENRGYLNDVYSYARVDLRNIDNEAGWFVVNFFYNTLQDGKVTHKVRHFINPDEIIKFEDRYDINFGEDVTWESNWQSEPIQKTRTITKYRTETQCD